MAEAKKQTKKSQTISDVEHPGKTAANPTSKSIIIKNGPIIKDPMVVEDTATKPDDDTTQNVVKAGGSSKIKLQPLPTSDSSEAIKDIPAADSSTKIDDEDKPTKDSAPEKPVEETAGVPKNDTASESPNVSTAKPTNSPAEEEVAEASRKAEHDANLQKILDSKTYYLPINAVEKRKTKRFVLLGITLSIFLILVWINIALDAGLIEINGISPLTSFFSS